MYLLFVACTCYKCVSYISRSSISGFFHFMLTFRRRKSGDNISEDQSHRYRGSCYWTNIVLFLH